MGNNTSQAVLNMQASSLSLTNANGVSTALTATGIVVPNKNLIGLRYMASGMTTAVPGSLTFAKIGPLAPIVNTYGTLDIPAASLVAGSTFEVGFSGLYTSAGSANVWFALVNGASATIAQTFVGWTDEVAMLVPITSAPASFDGKYTVTLQSFGSGTVTCYTSGQISFGTSSQVLQDERAFVIPPQRTNASMVATSGFSFSLWAAWGVSAVQSITLKRMTVTELI